MFQQNTETEPEHPPLTAVLDVITFLQRPVERIQTYQALLKVSAHHLILSVHVETFLKP